MTSTHSKNLLNLISTKDCDLSISRTIFKPENLLTDPSKLHKSNKGSHPSVYKSFDYSTIPVKKQAAFSDLGSKKEGIISTRPTRDTVRSTHDTSNNYSIRNTRPTLNNLSIFDQADDSQEIIRNNSLDQQLIPAPPKKAKSPRDKLRDKLIVDKKATVQPVKRTLIATKLAKQVKQIKPTKPSSTVFFETESNQGIDSGFRSLGKSLNFLETDDKPALPAKSENTEASRVVDVKKLFKNNSKKQSKGEVQNSESSHIRIMRKELARAVEQIIEIQNAEDEVHVYNRNNDTVNHLSLKGKSASSACASPAIGTIVIQKSSLLKSSKNFSIRRGGGLKIARSNSSKMVVNCNPLQNSRQNSIETPLRRSAIRATKTKLLRESAALKAEKHRTEHVCHYLSSLNDLGPSVSLETQKSKSEFWKQSSFASIKSTRKNSFGDILLSSVNELNDKEYRSLAVLKEEDNKSESQPEEFEQVRKLRELYAGLDLDEDEVREKKMILERLREGAEKITQQSVLRGEPYKSTV